MSAHDFSNCNSLFQAFMNETKDLSDPYAQFKKSLELASVSLPSTKEGAEGLSKRSISHMKHKAEILSKALDGKYRHSECLNLVANMCFFSSWKTFLSFAHSFPLLSEGQRNSSGDSVKLVSGIWSITENRQNYFFSKFIIASAMVLSMKSEVGLNDAVSVATKLFSDSKAKSTGDYLESKEVLEIIHSLHLEPGNYFVMYCLSQHPSRNGVRVKWGNLENIDLGRFLNKTIFLDSQVRIIEMPVIEAIAASIMGAIHSYAEASLPFFINGMFDPDKLASERDRIISALARDKTREEVHVAIQTLFSGHLTESVNHYITRQARSNGFIDKTVEIIQASGRHPKGLLSGSEITLDNGHSIKIYNNQSFASQSYANVGFKEITALSFSQDGLISGCIVLRVINNPSGSLKTLGFFCDEMENVPCIEGAVSLGMAGGLREQLNIRQPAFMTYWEVSRNYRGIGIGKALVNHVFGHVLKSLPDIDYVLAKVEPLEYPIPPLEDADQSNVTNYHLAKSKTLSIWNSVTNGGSLFAGRKIRFHSIGYQKNCHGHPNLLMTAMTLFELGA